MVFKARLPDGFLIEAVVDYNALIMIFELTSALVFFNFFKCMSQYFIVVLGQMLLD